MPKPKGKTAHSGAKFKVVAPGSTIGILAVSAPTEQERFQRGLRWLSAQGYKTKVMLEPYAAYGKKQHLFSSDTAEARVEALHALFRDDEVGAILSVRGAYGSMEMLPLLNFGLLKKHPKPLIGFSDVTALLLATYKLSGLVTVHGPSLESMSRAHEGGQREKNVKTLLQYLAGGLANPFQDSKLQTVKPGEPGEGPLLVGNLSMITSLMGTRYEPEFAGHILCIEESAERPFRIHRALLQMKLAGKFDQLRGVVLGSFLDCVHPKGLGPTVDDVMAEIFGEYPFPVLSGAPFGHGEENVPMALGVRARISSNNLEFVESPVLE